MRPLRGVVCCAALVGFLLPLLVLFVFSLVRAPYKQRDEARRALALGFPDVHIRIGGQGGDFEHGLFKLLNVRITNRGAVGASLNIRLYGKLKPGAMGEPQQEGEELPLQPVKLDGALATPVNVAPGTSVEGDLAFDMGRLEQQLIAGEHPDGVWRVEIEDLLSGQRISMRPLSEYPAPAPAQL